MTDEAHSYAERYTCPECQAGIMGLAYITYFTWLGAELITVPDFPAWICDVCGRRDYDSQAVSWLNTLLNAGGGHSKRSRHPKPLPQERPPAQP
ncbi:MAG: YgiT-type zinc finger protein [Anaerolineales bacterium]|nr:YgiT-type zinc finger protein [Anaerolineales bacterium]